MCASFHLTPVAKSFYVVCPLLARTVQVVRPRPRQARLHRIFDLRPRAPAAADGNRKAAATQCGSSLR